MPDLNVPAVVAEITALHDAYERALTANDVGALDGFFWDSVHTVRYGVSEHLYGADAIRAYRHTSAPGYTERVLERREVRTFGPAFAVVMCEIAVRGPERPRQVRQSQTWVRFPQLGWKIVAAHVSHAVRPDLPVSGWEAYLDQTSAALSLPIAREHRATVLRTLERTAAIAAPLLAFPVPPETEIAPVFTA